MADLGTVVDTITVVPAAWVQDVNNLAYRTAYALTLKYGAKGDGVTDDTAAIQAYIASNPAVLSFPPGIYMTTGFVIPANSTIGEMVGIGRPTLRRFGQGVVASGLNLTITAVYKNKLSIHGFIFDGNNTAFTVPPPPSTIPPDRTWYADLEVLTGVGNADPTILSPDFVEIYDCWFTNAPGGSIEGSQSQSTRVSGCKFLGWNDHGVYFSGAAAFGSDVALTADIIVEGNHFQRNGYTGGYAVKFRNRVANSLVCNNTYEVSPDGFVDIDSGNTSTTNYYPKGVAVIGNVGSCGIFLSMNNNFPVVNSTDTEAVLVAGNIVYDSTSPFYLAEDSTNAWCAHLHVTGNTFVNTSGIFATVINLRYCYTGADSSIVFEGNTCYDFGLAQIGGNWPILFRAADNILHRSYGAFVYAAYTADDDTIAKTAEFINNDFIQDVYASGSSFDIGVGTNSTVRWCANRFKNTGPLQLKSQPARLEFCDNRYSNSNGFLQNSSTMVARASAGVMIFSKNHNYSTSGASAVPYLYYENASVGGTIPLLNSYNIIFDGNEFQDVTGGITATGAQITAYVGSQKMYAADNYGTGTFSFSVAYNASYKQNTLPTATI